MRLIYYSLARAEGSAHEWQWIQSIRSLRSRNPWIPVTLFVFNGVSEAIQREADRWRVMVIPLGGYVEWLQRHHPRGWIMAMYPTLHKFLVLGEANTDGLSQALYVDCDTFFLDDPEILFESAGPHHWIARESPTSRLCPYGYNPANVNEELIDRIVFDEGLQRVTTFNSGVCLLNNGIWLTFLQLKSTFFDTVWRLLVGRHCLSASGQGDAHIRDAVLRTASADDVARALPYPSENFWIFDEIAALLTVGHILNLSQKILDREQVVQGYECVHAVREGRQPVLAHYFSCFQSDFFSNASLLS